MQVNVLEARNNLSRLVARAAAGEDVVIAERGVPLVRLVPASVDVVPGRGDVVVEWLESHPLPPRLARSGDEIDADAESEREGWE